MIKTIILLCTLYGMTTMYATSDHINNPLFCDRGNGLVYSEGENFIAIPVSWYSDDWQCGDEVIITWEDGTRLYSYALDAGPFDGLSVFVDGEYIPILADIPQHLFKPKGISAKAELFNLSLANRMMPESVKIDYLKQ